MELLHSPVISALLWIVAAGATAWILGPAVGFLLWRGPLRTDVSEDPGLATPRGDDRAYDDQAGKLIAMGFRPVGRTVESMRFMTPLHWHWRSHGSRQLVSPDGMTFVSFHRIAGAEPLRACAKTVFEGGGIAQTASPGVGLEVDYGGAGRRIEIGAADPATLLERHRQHVASFERTQAKVARRATLRGITAEDETFSQRAVTRSSVSGTYGVLFIFVMPLFGALQMSTRSHLMSSLRPLAICVFAAMFVAVRWMTLPSRVPRLVRMAVALAVLMLPTFGLMRFVVKRAAAHRPSHPPAAQVAPGGADLNPR